MLMVVVNVMVVFTFTPRRKCRTRRREEYLLLHRKFFNKKKHGHGRTRTHAPHKVQFLDLVFCTTCSTGNSDCEREDRYAAEINLITI